MVDPWESLRPHIYLQSTSLSSIIHFHQYRNNCWVYCTGCSFYFIFGLITLKMQCSGVNAACGNSAWQTNETNRVVQSTKWKTKSKHIIRTLNQSWLIGKFYWFRKILIRFNSGVDLIKLYFFGNAKFFRFLLLSLNACNIWKKYIYYEMAKLNSKNWKTKKKQSLVGSTPGGSVNHKSGMQ